MSTGIVSGPLAELALYIHELEQRANAAEGALEQERQEAGLLRARVEETDAVLAELPGLIAETVRQLDAISGGEPDADHGEADRILLDFAPPEIREAYERLVKRSGWWATA